MEDRDVSILFISTKFALDQLIDNGDLISVRKKLEMHTNTHRLKLILFPIRINGRVMKFRIWIYTNLGFCCSLSHLVNLCILLFYFISSAFLCITKNLKKCKILDKFSSAFDLNQSPLCMIFTEDLVLNSHWINPLWWYTPRPQFSFWFCFELIFFFFLVFITFVQWK